MQSPNLSVQRDNDCHRLRCSSPRLHVRKLTQIATIKHFVDVYLFLIILIIIIDSCLFSYDEDEDNHPYDRFLYLARCTVLILHDDSTLFLMHAAPRTFPILVHCIVLV